MVRRIAAPAALLALLAAAPVAHATTVVADDAFAEEPEAVALTSDGLVEVEDTSSAGAPRVLRIRPGQPAQGIAVEGLVAGSEGSSVDARLAASDGAIAVDAATGSPSQARVYVGPPAGPLRVAATCPKDEGALPVAVDGTRVAYVEGNCERRSASSSQPSRNPGTIVIADADPAVPARRIALPSSAAVTGLSLGAGGDRVSYVVEGAEREEVVAPLVPEGLGTPVVREDEEELRVVGTREDGATVFTRETGRGGCDTRVVVLPAGGAESALTTGCLEEPDDVLLVGGRLVTLQPSRSSDAVSLTPRSGSTTFTVRSTALTGGAPATLVNARDRRPRALAADATRVAYLTPACLEGNGEPAERLVVTDETTSTVAGCPVRVIDRRLRVSAKGRARLRLSCPLGCDLSITSSGRYESRVDAFASVRPGTGVVPLSVPRAVRRRKAVTLVVSAKDGPTVKVTLPLEVAR